MSSPKKHHFIPISYLKNFASENNGKFFVDIKHKQSDIRNVGIRDICRVDNLYTLPHVEGDKKYQLEKMYGKYVDGIYPEIYKMLTDPRKIDLTNDEKENIIITCLSFYFRTPKFLNENTRTLNAVFEYALKNCVDKDGFVKYQFKDITLDFHLSEAETYKTQLKITEKVKFLKEHVKQWMDYVNFKKGAAISVEKINGTKLITSDNPVSIYDSTGRLNNLFDAENMIKLPLDSRHYLTIYPEIVDNRLGHKILRSERDSMFGWILNNDSEVNSVDLLIGSNGSLNKHLEQQKALKELPANEVKAIVDNRIAEIADMDELTTYIENGNWPEIAKKADAIRKNPLYAENKEMQKLAFISLSSAKKKGFNP